MQQNDKPIESAAEASACNTTDTVPDDNNNQPAATVAEKDEDHASQKDKSEDDASQKDTQSSESSSGCEDLVDYKKYVQNLELPQKNRSAMRFTMDPKLTKWNRIAAHPGIQIYAGFDDMPFNCTKAPEDTRVATAG